MKVVPEVDVEYSLFKKGDSTKRISYKRFGDGSAYIYGDEELGFEGEEDGWLKAWKFLQDSGYLLETQSTE